MTSQEAQAIVATGIQELIEDPAQWQRWASTMSRFHTYSPGNALLIAMQRPDATLVAGFHTWHSLDRHVQKGEKGIAILAPVTQKAPADAGERAADRTTSTVSRTVVAFRPVPVFDIGQTAGRPLALPTVKDIVGDHLKDVLDRLVQHAVPVPVHYQPLEPGVYGVWRPAVGTMTISPQQEANSQLATLLHEWAHVISYPPGTVGTVYHRGTEEVAAETSAFVMANMLGLDTKAFAQGYVARWSDMRDANVKAVMGDVAHRVQTMARAIEQSRDPLLQQIAAAWSPLASRGRGVAREVALDR